MVWIPKLRNDVLTLRRLEKIFSCFDPGSATISGLNIILFEQNLYALQYQIKNFPPALLTDEKQNVIRSAIYNNREKSPYTIEDFRHTIQEEVNNILCQSHKKFFLYIPLKIQSHAFENQEINIFGTKIKFVEKDELKILFNIDEKKLFSSDLDKDEISKLINSDICFCLIEQFGRHKLHAAKEAFKKFELFRSILNFVVDYQSYELFPIKTQKSKSFVYPPKISFLFNDETKEVTLLLTDIQLEQKELNSKTDIETLQKSIPIIKEIIGKIEEIKDEKLKNLLTTSFEIHCDVLDYYPQNWISCFHLWQIIEILALYDNDISYDDVTKRIIALLGNFHPWYDTIQLFLQKRNNFVHRGNKSEFSQIDINSIKGLVQFSMQQLLNNLDEFKDLKGLRFFYEGLDYYFYGVDISTENCYNIMLKKRSMLKFIEERKIFDASNN